MKNCLLFTLGILLFCSNSASAQERNDSIITKYFLGSPYFKQHGKTLTIKKLSMAMKTEPEANELWGKAKKNYRVGLVFGYVGGFLTGFALGNHNDSEETLILLGTGLSFLGVSIPFQRKYNQYAKKAVKIYNSNL